MGTSDLHDGAEEQGGGGGKGGGVGVAADEKSNNPAWTGVVQWST